MISIIAIVISIVSVIFTALSFYFQHIREKYDVKATILSAYPGGSTECLCTVDIIFINNGNQQCSMATVNLEEVIANAKDAAMKGKIGYPFGNQLPFTLKPGDVISKQFIVAGKGKLTDFGFVNIEKGFIREWSVVFCIVDSRGKYHKIREPLFRNTVGEDNYSISKFPLVVNLLPSPNEESSVLFIRVPEKSGTN